MRRPAVTIREFLSRRDTGPVTVVSAAEPTLQHAHLDGVRSIELDYPFTPAVRWGGSLPPHPQFSAILDRGRDGDRDQLDAMAGQRDRLLEIPVHEVSSD